MSCSIKDYPWCLLIRSEFLSFTNEEITVHKVSGIKNNSSIFQQLIVGSYSMVQEWVGTNSYYEIIWPKKLPFGFGICMLHAYMQNQGPANTQMMDYSQHLQSSRYIQVEEAESMKVSSETLRAVRTQYCTHFPAQEQSNRGERHKFSEQGVRC